MSETYLLRSIKRLHDECEKALSGGNPEVWDSLTNRYEELLEEFKEEYSDNQTIQNIDSLKPRGAMYTSRQKDAIQEVKLKSLAIADALELNTEEFRRASGSSDMPVIEINQHQQQAQHQAQSQRVTVDSLIDDIDGLMQSTETKEDLKELVREYANEVEADDPDENRLRDILGSVDEYSSDIRQKLVMMAVEQGVDILSGMT